LIDTQQGRAVQRLTRSPFYRITGRVGSIGEFWVLYTQRPNNQIVFNGIKVCLWD